MKSLNFHQGCIESKDREYHAVCPSCLAKEVASWLKGKDLKTKKIVLEEVRKMMDFVDFQSHDCVVCKKQKAYLCPYCFTEKVYWRMEKKKMAKETRKDFLDFFGSKFENSCLVKEMKKQGMI